MVYISKRIFAIPWIVFVSVVVFSHGNAVTTFSFLSLSLFFFFFFWTVEQNIGCTGTTDKTVTKKKKKRERKGSSEVTWTTNHATEPILCVCLCVSLQVSVFTVVKTESGMEFWQHNTIKSLSTNHLINQTISLHNSLPVENVFSRFECVSHQTIPFIKLNSCRTSYVSVDKLIHI